MLYYFIRKSLYSAICAYIPSFVHVSLPTFPREIIPKVKLKTFCTLYGDFCFIRNVMKQECLRTE